MTAQLELITVPIEKSEESNLILGQAHFIKTVEDLYEALAGSSPHLRFGIAFCESSGPRLVRRTGNDEELVELAVRNAVAIGSIVARIEVVSYSVWSTTNGPLRCGPSTRAGMRVQVDPSKPKGMQRRFADSRGRPSS